MSFNFQEPPIKTPLDRDGAVAPEWSRWFLKLHSIISPTVQEGTTAQRPNPKYKGQLYFDTTLGKQLWSDGTSWIEPSLKSEVDALPTPVEIPIGTILDYGGTSLPTNFVECDGSAVSRTVTYDQLFTAIGTTWGVGDGSTTFNLPDFRRRVSVGAGGTGTGTLGNAEGDTGGAETHTLTTSEMPAHTHTQTESQSAGGSGSTAPDTTGSTAESNVRETQSTGGDGAHNNMQPSAVVMKIIRYQ